MKPLLERLPPPEGSMGVAERLAGFDPGSAERVELRTGPPSGGTRSSTEWNSCFFLRPCRTGPQPGR
ncbi:MAG: hypothetical protein ACOYX1_19160 [Acidobacteriota bacterium]